MSAPPVASGPPVSGSPYGDPYGYQPPAPAQRRSVAFPLLIASAALLVLATLGVAAFGFSALGNVRDEVSALESERDKDKKQEEATAAKLESDFKAADLPAKYQKVKDLDKVADTKHAGWEAGTIKLGELNKAMQACDDQADEYNRAAAPFPAAKFNSQLPQKIDLANRETDCGRAFISEI